jgi:hypothetical protein
MEIIDSHSQEIRLPAAFEIPFEKLGAAFTRPFARLLLKELRLQRTGALFTAAFCCIAACEFVAQKINPTMDGVYFVVTIGTYLALFPLLVGASAVAEEKSWGLKDWHLTLPPSMREQWRAKWLVALGLSVALGAGLAFLFSLINPGPTEVQFDLLGLGILLVLCSLGAAIAMYAASVSVSNLRAILLSLGLLVLAVSVFVAMAKVHPEAEGFWSVFASLMRDLYHQILQVMWNLIVCPVWWCTHSVAKTGAVARWADISENNLAIIFMVFYVFASLWLILSFARTNYAPSDLPKRRILKHLFVIILLAAFAGSIMNDWDHRPNTFDLPRWTLLPAGL